MFFKVFYAFNKISFQSVGKRCSLYSIGSSAGRDFHACAILWSSNDIIIKTCKILLIFCIRNMYMYAAPHDQWRNEFPDLFVVDEICEHNCRTCPSARPNRVDTRRKFVSVQYRQSAIEVSIPS